MKNYKFFLNTFINNDLIKQLQIFYTCLSLKVIYSNNIYYKIKNKCIYKKKNK